MNRLFSNIYVLVMMSLLLILGGCHEDFPEDIEGEAALWFQADMPVERLLEGGKNGYELKTEIAMGDLGVEEYSAIFRQTGCENCTGQMRLVFRDYNKKDEIDFFQIDSTFRVGNWPYRGQDIQPNTLAAATNPLSFRFLGNSDGLPPFSYEWEFGDGYVSTSPAPIHTYGSAGDFEVNLRIQDATGCSDQSFQKVSVGNNYIVCPYDFDILHLGGQNIEFTVNRLDGIPLDNTISFFWDFGFGATASIYSDTSSFQFNFPFEGIFPVTLLVLDSCGCPCPVTKNIYTAVSPSCVSEIAFKTVPEDKEKSRVTLEWTDESGAFYTSYGPNGQPTASDFQIIDRKLYKNNPLGKGTYSFSASFDCILYNPANPNDSIIVKNGQSIFALEKPE